VAALLDLYRSLRLIRRAEEEIARIYPSDKIKSPVHLAIGQEAVAVGVCAALRRDDALFGTYRSHHTYLAKGGDLRAMIAELYGKATGCARGKGGSMHLMDLAHGVFGTSAVVATTIPHAVGYAWARRQQGRDAIAVAFFGDGATEEGVFGESLNVAQVKNAPVLFVCENNGLAIHSRQRDRQANANIWQRAEAYGVPSQRIDGNDVLTIADAAARVVGEMRGGAGPRLLECETFRWREHVGPGDDWALGYRDPAEAQPWIADDQIERIGRQLAPAERATIDRAIEADLADAFAFAEASPFPSADELYADLYAEAKEVVWSGR
jgi:TPP-dependent pyruvate/acetoin dehydrogenase alpha subunit